MLISEAFELYRIEYIVYRNQSASTEEQHLLSMKSLIKFAGDIKIIELTFDIVRKWKDHLSKRLGQNTIRGYIIKLRRVLGHLRLKGIEVIHPDIVGVPKREKKAVEFITKEEVAHLIECTFKAQAGYSKLNRYRNRTIISLLYSSGIRVSELIKLDRLSIREDNTFTVVGKGGKPRLCFIDKRTREYIVEYLKLRTDNNKALFISENTGKRISANTVQEVFRTVQRKSGIDKHIHPHTLRHSFATNLLRNNTNLVYVRDFLGHNSIQTTEMYTHVVDEDLKSIYLEKHSI